MIPVLFHEARYTGPVELPAKALHHLKGKRVGLFMSVQFLPGDSIKNQLEKSGCSVVQSQPHRAHYPGQVLGCDSYEHAYEDAFFDRVDVMLYVGDGQFHPKALLYAQARRSSRIPIMIWNPKTQHMNTHDTRDLSIFRRRLRQQLQGFILAKKIGILVSTKHGQEYMTSATHIRTKLERQGKQAVVFLTHTVDLTQTDNFPFVDAWVNTACPRIGHDDSAHVNKPLVNAYEARHALQLLEELPDE